MHKQKKTKNILRHWQSKAERSGESAEQRQIVLWMLLDIFTLIGVDIAFSAFSRLTKTHTVRLNSWELFWRKKQNKKQKKERNLFFNMFRGLGCIN